MQLWLPRRMGLCRGLPYDAIKICEGVAQVDPLLCRACKLCVATCPKRLITLMPLHERKAAVMCHNMDKGGPARKACKAHASAACGA